jgi:hypothetical protein
MRTFRLVERSLRPGCHEIQVEGEIDLAVADQLRESLEEAAAEHDQILIGLQRCECEAQVRSFGGRRRERAVDEERFHRLARLPDFLALAAGGALLGLGAALLDARTVVFCHRDLLLRVRA